MYESALRGGIAHNVSASTIENWCDGYSQTINNKERTYSPKENCWSMKRYT